MKPLNDLVLVFRKLFRILKWASFAVILVTVLVLAYQVAEIHGILSSISPWLGHAFLLAVLAFLVLGVGVPAFRYLRVPVALRPPDLPAKDETVTMVHLKSRATFLVGYVKGLRRNPLLAESSAQIEETLRACEETKRRLDGRPATEVEPARAELAELERTRIDALLAPIDLEVDRLIRREAMGVGIATAISPNGTLDAFIVLWRAANLVSRIATLYYGRPGARGSLVILRDVSAATLLATYLEGLSDMAGGLIGSLLGGVAGAFAGPILDGGINALATLRIGYTARGRCRSFRAWTEASRKAALRQAFSSARAHGKDVLGEIVKQAGGGASPVFS
jgi:putative membrane protein